MAIITRVRFPSPEGQWGHIQTINIWVSRQALESDLSLWHEGSRATVSPSTVLGSRPSIGRRPSSNLRHRGHIQIIDVGFRGRAIGTNPNNRSLGVATGTGVRSVHGAWASLGLPRGTLGRMGNDLRDVRFHPRRPRTKFGRPGQRTGFLGQRSGVLGQGVVQHPQGSMAP